MLDPKQLQKWSAGQNHERPPLPITATCSCMMIHENNCINNYRKQLCCRMHKNTPRYLRLSVFVSLSIFFIIKEKATKLLCLLESFIPLLLKNNIHDIFVLMEERQRAFCWATHSIFSLASGMVGYGDDPKVTDYQWPTLLFPLRVKILITSVLFQGENWRQVREPYTHQCSWHRLGGVAARVVGITAWNGSDLQCLPSAGEEWKWSLEAVILHAYL